MLSPTAQQNTLVQTPVQVRFPPLRDAGRSRFHSLVWEVSAMASAHPPITLGQLQAVDKGQPFAPMAANPLPAQQQKTQQHKNSLTQNEKGPHFLLMPPTDRLHSLQTYNNTKKKNKPKPTPKKIPPKPTQCHPTSEKRT